MNNCIITKPILNLNPILIPNNPPNALSTNYNKCSVLANSCRLYTMDIVLQISFYHLYGFRTKYP